MLFIGLTGSIATGKSTVGKIFKELGCYVIDADGIAHKAYEKGTKAYKSIVEEFGKNILDKDGNIDRKKLGGVVLDNKELLKKLEAIVHPEVERIRNNIIEDIKKKNKNAIIIYDVPLLFEKNLEGMFDYTIVVYADKDTEIKRLMERNGLKKDEAIKRILLQIPIEDKAKKADFVIDNSGSLNDTRKQVKDLFEKLKNMDR
jgi:dephospho-CoA kinase